MTLKWEPAGVHQAQYVGSVAGVRSRAESGGGTSGVGTHRAEGRCHPSDVCISIPVSPFLMNFSGCWFKKQ